MRVGWQEIGQLNDNEADSIQRAIIIPAKEALRQTRQALTGNLTLRDNQYAAIVTLGTSTTSMTSGTEWTFANPLATKPIGFTVLTTTDTVGVAIQLDAPPKLNTSRTDGLLGLTAISGVPLSGLGSIGERYTINRLRSNAVAISNGVSANVCTTASVSIPPGTWIGSGIVGFSGAAGTTVTNLDAGISKTSATLPATDTIGVPASGESRMRYNSSSTIITGGEWLISIPPYKSVFTTTTTLFLVANSSFAVATANAWGSMEFVRLVSGNIDVPPNIIVTGILWGG